jgi:hypothetical protein
MGIYGRNASRIVNRLVSYVLAREIFIRINCHKTGKAQASLTAGSATGM